MNITRTVLLLSLSVFASLSAAPPVSVSSEVSTDSAQPPASSTFVINHPPSVNPVDAPAAATADSAGPLDLSKIVITAAENAGITVASSAVAELQKQEARVRAEMVKKANAPREQSRIRESVKTLSDAIIADAKANPSEPITAGSINRIMLRLCPLFPFCS
jgi:hypothetical protein